MDVVTGTPLPVVASPGTEDRARVLAGQVEDGRRWVASRLGVDVELVLRVVSEADWDDVAEVPVRLPHAGDRRMTVGAEQADFFSAVARDWMPHVGASTRDQLVAACGPDLDLGPFVDAITAHEMGHLVHQQDEVDFPRFWLDEYFANVVMAGYVAEVAPHLQPMVEAFAAAATEVPATRFPVHALADMEESLEVGEEAYVWYEMVQIWFALALWDQAGPSVARRMLDQFRDVPAASNDQAVLDQLDSIHPSASDVVTKWPIA